MKNQPVPNALTRTASGNTGTFTSAGFIPHLDVPTTSGKISAPVKILFDTARRGIAVVYESNQNARVPTPPMRNGKYVFALPGGKEIEA